jgi:hypothetical protein
MTNVTVPFRIQLDSGETVEIDPAHPDEVVLRMARWRADDLSAVLDAYTRLITWLDRTSQISGTEHPLAHALHTAATL